MQPNPQYALYWYNYAAKQGDVYALTAMGYMYRNGVGVKKDPVRALGYYRAAAEKGHIPAELALARMYEFGEGDKTKGPPDAALWYYKAAKEGSAEAQMRMGFIYENGYGLPQDGNAALKWYTEAMHKGHYMPALMSVARIYLQGKIVPRDVLKSSALYQACANTGISLCQYELGMLYKTGTGVSQDLGQAYMWLALAAQGLPPGSQQQRDAVVQRIAVANAMKENDLTQARASVNTWQPQPDSTINW